MSTRFRPAFDLLACVLLLVAVACQAAKPAATPPSYANNIQASEEPVPASTERTGATPIPATPLAPSPTVGSVPTSLPPDKASASSSPITAENATTLHPVAHRSFGAWDQVLKLVWSPDGSSLATSAGQALHILDSPGLEDRLVIRMDSWAPDVTFAPSAHSLAAVDRNGVLRIWNIETGELLQSIQAHQKSGSGVAYRPDGSLLATAGYDAMSRIWELPSGKKLGEMIGGTFAVPAIAFTPDGASLAIVNGNIIRLRDVGSQRFVRTIAAENPIYTIAISPDGGRLASGDVANTVQMWDMATAVSPAVEIRESLMALPVQKKPVSGVKALVWQVAFSPDGSLLAAASGDGRIRIWEAESGSLLAELASHSKAATSLAFSPDGRWLASGGLDGKVILWGTE